jgi:hypothetical protein
MDWSESRHEVVLEFWEACVHQVLYARGVYPAPLFVQRSKFGVSVWQSVHKDINGYVQRVLGNVKPLLEAGVIAHLLITITPPPSAGGREEVEETISLGCEYQDHQRCSPAGLEELDQLERELGAVLLKLALLDGPALKTDSRFSLLISTLPCNDDAQLRALEHAASSQQWIVDGERHPGGSARGLQFPSAFPQQDKATCRPIKSLHNVAFIKSLQVVSYR